MSTLGIKKAERGIRAATGAKDKAIRLVGVDSDSVMAQAYQGPTTAETFAMFWGRVEDKPKELGSMAMVLLKKVNELLGLTVDKSTTVESKEEKQLPIELLASMNTLSMLALFFPCSSVHNKQALIGQLDAYYEDEINLTRRLPNIKEPMRLIRHSIEGVDLLGAAIIGASTLHSAAETLALRNIVELPTVDPFIPSTMESSFWYEWLRDTALESEAKRTAVLTGILNKVLTLPQQLKMNALMGRTTAFSLFHMFTNIFSMRPMVDLVFLERASAIVNQLLVWPVPICTLAQNALALIQREVQWPGSAMLAVLEQESRVGQQENAGRSRCLYYFYDSAIEGARLLFKDVGRFSNPLDKDSRAKTGPWKRRPSHQLKNRVEEVSKESLYRLPPVSKALVMMNWLFNDCALTEAEAKTISEISPATIDVEFGKILAAKKDLEAKHQPVALFVECRKQLLMALKKTLLTAKSGGQAPADFPLTPPYTCLLPRVEHIAVETECLFESTPSTPKENAQLECLAYIPFPQPSQYFDHLEYIQHQHAMEPKPCEARVMICGGDRALHCMLCAYLHSCQLAHISSNGINFKFYLLPFGENSIAQYIARNDGWYRRHVYKPCMTRSPVLPWLNPGTESKEDEYGISLVGRFFRETFATYAREARNTFNVQVWLAKGWIESEQKQEDPKGKVDKLAAQPDYSIPFISYCEIGIQAQAEEYRKKKKIKTIDEVISISSLGFVYNPPEIGVEFTPADLRGHSLNNVEEDPEKYRSVVLRNVPKAGEKAFPANPQSGSLELSASFLTVKAAAAYSKNLLATEPVQRVNGVRLACTAPKATFHIVCDGESFGPFHHVVIEPARHNLNPNTTTYGGVPVSQGDPVFFPIQTFFPIK